MEIIERLNRAIERGSATYGRGDKKVTGYTDDAKLLIAARDTILADTQELARLRQDNLRLIESLNRYLTPALGGRN